MAKVLKICCGTWQNASRDKRELSVYKELGADVVVMAKGELGDKFRRDTVDGYEVYRFTTMPLGKYGLWKINNSIGMLLWSWYARKFKADVISCHDIFALLVGWLSTLFVAAEKKPKLIYDSHEFEIGRNAKRSKLKTWYIIHLERFLIKRCAFSIVVCDSIADELQRVHQLEQRPVVVRSTPEYWEIDPEVCQENREALLRKFPETVKFLLMYHGNINRGRGIELILPILEEHEDMGLILMGAKQGADEVENLEKKANELGIENRILYLPPVPQPEIWRYVGAADLEMMLIQPIVKSYYFALPNKFFESVQSLTPMVASDLPEMKALINRYQIGLCCNVDDINDISRCVGRMQKDRDFYDSCKRNLEKAKQDLCWEEEKKVLSEAYTRLFS